MNANAPLAALLADRNVSPEFRKALGATTLATSRKAPLLTWRKLDRTGLQGGRRIPVTWVGERNGKSLYSATFDKTNWWTLVELRSWHSIRSFATLAAAKAEAELIEGRRK